MKCVDKSDHICAIIWHCVLFLNDQSHWFLSNVEFYLFIYIFQAAAIRLEIRGGEWKNAYMQMDGEPWKQPLSKDFSTFVEIKREPFQSVVVSGK